MLLSKDRVLDISAQAQILLHERIMAAYDGGTLVDYLNSVDMSSLLPKEIVWDNEAKNGKIIIIGSSSVKEKDIMGLFKAKGFSKDRIVLYLGYEEFKRFHYEELQYSMDVRLILAGPMPHSTQGKGNYSSTIAMMEQTEGYPKVVRLGADSNQASLKITKTNISRAIDEELKEHYIVAA